MDKNAIKKYAVWARRELIERVSQRALIYGVSSKDVGDPNAESINGHLLSQAEKRQRQALIRNLKDKGYEQVMEEVAYTWFNRFAALRFMEVNGYLPSHIRVFTNDTGEFKPQILSEAIHLDLAGLNMEKVYELEQANKTEELFKYLLIVQCNALNSILPGMFQKIDDYTELLLPDYLLREGSVIEQMVTTIPESDWTNQVQIIGWLYQYYNTEPKDKVFANLKKNIKISKENIPAATQLFTPDWIVHYMVENSLGRLWLEGHPNDALKSEWKYYLDEAEQEPEVQAQLDTIRKEYAALKPEEIRVIDPCQGSGHILCVLFDTLIKIYEDYGYTAREAAASIVQNNLWGLDIDERASQLAYFSVVMKARQYDRRFFTRGIQPHVYAFEESNGITSAPLHNMCIGMSQEEYVKAVKQATRLIEEFHDAKEYGSILNISEADWNLLRKFAVPRWESEGGQISLNIHGEVEVVPHLQALINLGQAMTQKYHVVVTNPPYMSSAGMTNTLNNYVKKFYPDGKSDLFAVFIEKCRGMITSTGLQSMITQHVWMFLSGFINLRESICNNDILTMLHLGPRAFEEISGEVVQTTAFVLRKYSIPSYKGTFVRLVDAPSQNAKENLFLSGRNRFFASNEIFSFIPEKPIVYWLGDKALMPYKENAPLLGSIAAPCAGLSTGDNNLFQRFWYEVSFQNIGFDVTDVAETLERKEKWFPCNSSGEFRKWCTDDLLVVNWQNDGDEIRHFRNAAGKLAARPQNTVRYFKEGLTWNKLSRTRFAVKYKAPGFVFDDTSRSAFPHDLNKLYYYIGSLCSGVTFSYLQALDPTMSFTNGDLVRIPMVEDETKIDAVTSLVKECIECSKKDWDSFETSWNFQRHPLIIPAVDRHYIRLSDCWKEWGHTCAQRFAQLKSNEEELNRIFIDIYGLQDELTPDVENKDVTVRKAHQQRDIRSLLSYAVGCMFGRYSFDVPGLVYAGGTWDASKYTTFQPDKDAIIPICDDEYFEDDIVGRFVDFVRRAFGESTLEENLRFIADALGGKGSSREVIQNYFINDFYANHLKIYQKRPIYWLFDSGKKNGFKCLIYIHRYQPDTIARIRTDYVHEQQARYRTAIADLENQISNASTSERVKLTKRLQTLQAQAEEVRVYEEKIHHLADQMIKIDLDDGVKHNYAIFQDVLAKIK